MPEISESTYPQGPVLVDGYYPAQLIDVREYKKTYEGREHDRLAWIFDVQADEGQLDDAIEIEDAQYEFDGHFEVAAYTGARKSNRSNSNWFKLDMNTLVGEGITDTDEVIGARCIVNVSSFTGEDGITKNTIEKIRPPKKNVGGKRAQAKVEEASEKEEDFADLPF